MANTGLEELTEAVRAVLLEDSAFAGEELAFGRAAQEDNLPYVVFNFRPMRVYRRMGPSVTLRQYRGEFIVCTEEARGMATAQPLKDAVFARFTETIDGLTPQERLNVYLNPVGWSSDVVIEPEMGEIAPYTDYVGKERTTARWHTGVQFDFRIQRI